MFVMLVILTIFLVPCKKVADRIGKANTYALGVGIASIGLIVAVFLPHHATNIIFVVAAITGIGFSSQWICPHSMMPDVIEYDELESGEHRAGIFYGMNSFISKITGALGTAVCGWVLKLTGYVEGAEQTATALFGIRTLFTVLPVLLLVISIILLLRYPINRKTHGEVVRELEKRRALQSGK
jgi:GPH family glycoside/pentoside/hexuronide:cation symporter